MQSFPSFQRHLVVLLRIQKPLGVVQILVAVAEVPVPGLGLTLDPADAGYTEPFVAAGRAVTFNWPGLIARNNLSIPTSWVIPIFTH